MEQIDPIRREAERRHWRHVDHPTHRPLSVDYELVGLRGEQAFSELFGGSVDLEAKPLGDGGADNALKLRTNKGVVTYPVDIKTARKPGNLIIEEGKAKRQTIYFLAYYIDELDIAYLLGWEWGWCMAQCPVKDFGYGVKSHYQPLELLRSISQLRERQARD